MRYKNKVDIWIRITLYLCTLMFLPMIFFVPEDEIYILIISMAAMALIVLPLFYGYIELADDEVIIRVGYFRQKIKYEKIKSLRLCTNYLSSMAMTKDRIEIKIHKKGFLFGTTHIGPENREECFEELKRRCYNLETK